MLRFHIAAPAGERKQNMTIVYDIEDFSSLDARKLFLRVAFGDDWEEKAFLVNEPEWGTRRRLEELDGTHGCFWGVGAVPWGKARRNENVENVRALVIDDVGTKVDVRDAMSLDIGMPTAIIGTSEKNYQYVYRFAKPAPVAEFNRFRHGLLGDLQGAVDGKDAAHIFRLPWGINRKPGRGGFAVNGRLGRSNTPIVSPDGNIMRTRPDGSMVIEKAAAVQS